MTSEMQERPVLIVGAGGHGKVVAEALLQSGRSVLGFTDASRPKGETVYQELAVLGDDTIIRNWDTDRIYLANGVGSLPGTSNRARLFHSLQRDHYVFTTIVHPSAILASDVSLAEGAQVMAGAIIQPGVRIGANTIVNTASAIDHDCQIGMNCHIAPGCTLSGGVKIGDNVHLGTGASVIQSIEIGAGAVVGAGSVVLSDVIPGVTVVGCPARPKNE